MTYPASPRSPHVSYAAGALFPFGRIVATPGAIQAFDGPGEMRKEAAGALRRHLRGDWGGLDEEDKLRNHEALKIGGMLLSAWQLSSGVKFWIITDSDRQVTTFLLPEEY